VSALLGAMPDIECVADHVVARAVLDDVATRVTRWLDDFHAQHPTVDGAPLASMREIAHASAAVVDHVIASLAEKKVVVVTATQIRRANWRGTGDPAADARKTALLARLVAASAEVPSVRELERECGASTMATLRQLERAGAVVALSVDRFASADAALALWSRVSAQLSADRVYTPSELRPIFGLSRQYLIAWLEYFDRIGHSRREGDGRRFRGT
jgi:selenocysteine-specific elongation factor